MKSICKIWNYPTFVPQDEVIDFGNSVSVDVQFNINIPDGPGVPLQRVVRVNAENEGNCEITLPDNKRVVGRPKWEPVAESGTGMWGKVEILAPSIRDGGHGNDVVWFRLRDINGSAGTVTARFLVDYA